MTIQVLIFKVFLEKDPYLNAIELNYVELFRKSFKLSSVLLRSYWAFGDNLLGSSGKISLKTRSGSSQSSFMLTEKPNLSRFTERIKTFDWMSPSPEWTHLNLVKVGFFVYFMVFLSLKPLPSFHGLRMSQKDF